MRILVALFFVLLIVLSCSDKNKVPRGILPPPKMQAVLWDMLSVGEFLNGYVFVIDSLDRMNESSKKYGQVLQFHNITREEFDRSYLYYRQHNELMKVVLDSLSKRQADPAETFKPRADSAKADTTKIDSAKVDSMKVVSAKIDSIKQGSRKKMFDTLKRVNTLRRDSLKKRMRRRLAVP